MKLIRRSICALDYTLGYVALEPSIVNDHVAAVMRLVQTCSHKHERGLEKLISPTINFCSTVVVTGDWPLERQTAPNRVETTTTTRKNHLRLFQKN